MILTKLLAWHHLPKTAGTTTDKLFQLSGLPLLWRDDQSSPDKHLPPAEHLGLPSLGTRKKLINIRRLPDWLLSNFQHKKLFMKLDLEIEPMKKGYFYKAKSQEWFPADWWLERMGVNEEWLLLRVEYLKKDFLNIIQDNEPINFDAKFKIYFARERNKNKYNRNLMKWFSREDIIHLYKTNPLWANLEYIAYGDLLEIDEK